MIVLLLILSSYLKELKNNELKMLIEITYERANTQKFNVEKLEQLQNFLQTNYNTWFSAEQLTIVINVGNIRPYIAELRNSGLPVISSNRGYKVTNNKDEIRECYEQLRTRALRTLTAAKNMKKYL